jgi:hypothetical protein
LKPAKEHGNPVQIESLVTFRFETKVVASDPIPVLTVADMAHQTVSCKPSSISPGLLPSGTVVTVRVSVNETGDALGASPVGRCPVKCGLLAGPIVSIQKRKFAPLHGERSRNVLSRRCRAHCSLSAESRATAQQLRAKPAPAQPHKAIRATV